MGTARRTLCMLSMVAVLAAGLAVVPPAQAGESAEPQRHGCDDAARDCVEQQQGFLPIPGGANLIAAYLPVRNHPKARRAYQALLPPGFELPAKPVFNLLAFEYHAGARVPVAEDVPGMLDPRGGAGWGTHWMELGLQMRVKFSGTGEEGWYYIAIGTDGNIAYGGIDLGYAKYRAHTTFDQWPDRWRASATVLGDGTYPHADPDTWTTTMALDWRADERAPAPVASHERDIWAGRGADAEFFLKPVHQGPETHRLLRPFMPAVPAQWLAGGALPDAAEVPPATGFEPMRPGWVHVQLEPNLDLYDHASEQPLPNLLAGTRYTLADIVDVDTVVPGVAWRLEQGILFTQSTVVRGSDGQ